MNGKGYENYACYLIGGNSIIDHSDTSFNRANGLRYDSSNNLTGFNDDTDSNIFDDNWLDSWRNSIGVRKMDRTKQREKDMLFEKTKERAYHRKRITFHRERIDSLTKEICLIKKQMDT